MQIKGKTSDFIEMLNISTLNGVFESLVLNVSDKISIAVKETSEKVSVMHKGVYMNFFEIEVDGEEEIGIETKDLLSQMKLVFKGDEVITWKRDDNDILITGTNDQIITSILEPDSVGSYIKNSDKTFMLGKSNELLYKGGKTPPTTIAKMDAEILRGVEQRGSAVKQEFYPIILTPPDNIQYTVGDRKDDRSKNSIVHKEDGIQVEGEPLTTIVGSGLKNVVGVLSGEVQISGLNGSPLWIWYEDENKKLGFFIASRDA